MKKFLSVLFIALLSASSAIAHIAMVPGKANAPIQGGEDGINYAAIFSSGANSRKEAIQGVVDFLIQYKIITNPDDVLKNLKDYDDTQTEFSFPAAFRIGFHTGQPVMGVAPVYDPMVLEVDMRFQFYDDGTVRLVFGNLHDYSYCMLNTIYKSRSVDYETEIPDYKNYHDVASMSSGIGKMMGVLLTGIANVQEYNKAVANMLDEVDEQFQVMEKMTPRYCLLLSPEEEVELMKDAVAKEDSYVPANAAGYQIENAEKCIAEGKMMNVSDYIWRTTVKVHFDYVIAKFNESFGSVVTGIAQDGEVIWEQFEGKLLPVDAKLRKSLIKSGEDYFTYYK